MFTDKERSDFLKGYVTCALWTGTDGTTEAGGDPLDDNYGSEDICPNSLEGMRRDCNAWMDANAADVKAYCAQIRSLTECTDMERCGHDLWLTRNGHGTGFQDRGGQYGDGLTEDLAQRLTDAAHKAGERWVILGSNGQIIHGGTVRL